MPRAAAIRRNSCVCEIASLTFSLEYHRAAPFLPAAAATFLTEDHLNRNLFGVPQPRVDEYAAREKAGDQQPLFCFLVPQSLEQSSAGSRLRYTAFHPSFWLGRDAHQQRIF